MIHICSLQLVGTWTWVFDPHPKNLGDKNFWQQNREGWVEIELHSQNLSHQKECGPGISHAVDKNYLELFKLLFRYTMRQEDIDDGESVWVCWRWWGGQEGDNQKARGRGRRSGRRTGDTVPIFEVASQEIPAGEPPKNPEVT